MVLLLVFMQLTRDLFAIAKVVLVTIFLYFRCCLFSSLCVLFAHLVVDSLVEPELAQL